MGIATISSGEYPEPGIRKREMVATSIDRHRNPDDPDC